uniref:AB hydrolase-1 domain-containing protein n=1 Tax=Panagrolaimus sp. PS1159 TaxID=55785 RepID=A0AC35G8F8_9BILA
MAIRDIIFNGVLYATTAFYSTMAAITLGIQYIKYGNAMLAHPPHLRPKVLDKWKHNFLKISDIKIHYVEAGNPKNPLMLCVHGFPEFWYSYRFQLDYFKDKYHIVAIDMRGYGESDKPVGVANYGIDLLVKDLDEIITGLGKEKAFVVAHDWGAVVAWFLAILKPQKVEKLVILNVPHPRAFQKYLMTTLSQFRRSWYMFFFVCPYLPEISLRSFDMRALVSMFRGSKTGLVHKENFTDEDVEAWKYIFSMPHGMSGPINYYRAMMRRFGSPPKDAKTVTPPTLIIWGEKDAALDVRAAENSLTYCTQAQLKRIPDASHWVQQDKPQLVNEYIDKFLAEEILPFQENQNETFEKKSSL